MEISLFEDLPPNAYELDSNGSIAPSQSASQVGYDDIPSTRHRGGVPFPRGLHGPNGPGSITGSIAEENEEGSSDDDAPRNLTVHENRPGAATPRPSSAQAGRINSGGVANYKTGVPSVTNYRTRPMSASYGNEGQNDSDSDGPGPRRRAASDVGGMAYTPITKRRSLRRAQSDDRQPNALTRTSSNASSGRGVPVKKKGFFASIGRLFKSNKRRDGSSGRDSPPYGMSSSKGGWSTRTDTNIKRASSGFGNRRRGGDDSSSDEEGGNLVSVSNNRNSTWSVDNVGRSTGSVGGKRNSNLPVASGLIPAKPTRSDLGAGKRAPGSTSTVTARNTTGRAGAKSPTGTMTRSNTVKSTASVAKSTATAGTAKTPGTVKSNTGSVKKTRANGSISRATGLGSQPATNQNNLMSLVSKPDTKNPAVPIMPDIPKAPRSHVTPQMELPKAPGSSIVRPGDAPRETISKDELYPHQSISRSNSLQKVPQVKSQSGTDNRSTTPLPSRFQPAPLKSALRPSSPTPLAPPLEMPKTLISVTAPGPVEVPRDLKPAPSSFPIAPAQTDRPRASTRASYQSMTTEEGASVYESAVDGQGGRDYNAESSSEEEEEYQGKKYEYVDNERVKRLGINVGPPAVERIPSGNIDHDSDAESIDTELAGQQSHYNNNNQIEDDRASRASRSSRQPKSVRITAPDSPMDTVHAPPPLTEGYPAKGSTGAAGGTDRDPSPEPARPTDQKWSTRIGRMRDDTSDEEDVDEGYDKARRTLSRNSGVYEEDKGRKLGKSKSGSVRSKSSKK